MFINIINSNLYILFGLDNETVNKIMKLKYLDVSMIYNIYNNQKKRMEVCIFLLMVLKHKSYLFVNDAKQTIYFIIYKDIDNI